MSEPEAITRVDRFRGSHEDWEGKGSHIATTGEYGTPPEERHSLYSSDLAEVVKLARALPNSELPYRVETELNDAILATCADDHYAFQTASWYSGLVQYAEYDVNVWYAGGIIRTYRNGFRV